MPLMFACTLSQHPELYKIGGSNGIRQCKVGLWLLHLVDSILSLVYILGICVAHIQDMPHVYACKRV